MPVCSLETRGIVGASPDLSVNPVLVISPVMAGYLLLLA